MLTSPNIPAAKLIWSAISEIELFKSFVDGIEEQIIAQEIKLQDPKNIIVNTFDVVHGKSTTVIDGISDQQYNLSNIFEVYFPNLQRKSIFISIYSFLEDILNNLCYKLQKTKSLELELEDLHGKGIDRARLYLEKVIHFDFHSLESIWEEIKIFQKLRNEIVHTNGKIKLEHKNQRLQKYINTLSLFTLSDNNIILNKTFLPYFLNKLSDFFNLIFNSLNNRQ